ncbi:hypothetical protein RND81_11G029400 [Saponaria officinalis]|uniref:Protein FAR1-RELATED SEQUENCE n=1 Tax=Saponaria officinalis TaxID=3572 RepID=A0AAW1HH57_SAPOF
MTAAANDLDHRASLPSPPPTIVNNEYQQNLTSSMIESNSNTGVVFDTALELQISLSVQVIASVYNEFQEELKGARFSCGIESINQEATEHISVMDPDKKKVFVVDFNSEREKLECSCRKFERHGILCRHALLILKDMGFDKVPDKYMISRWSKLATCRPIFNVDETLLNDCKSLDVTKNRISELWSDMFTCVTLIEQKP